ncbi:nitrate/nitrite transporter NrtS [Bradyrhizobium sp. BR13661]|uniref:nitrate/nitrite transporter NrtS n=1 Tax=Bradyrhizobium sp. BR13661 TaxID=2940622 RepID=UPI00247420E0|nr:nitrate/nitrite transporter NrtS [Bradyrhizobium sp. BR13661]
MSDGIPRRSFFAALVVGTVLNLINQGDALFGTMAVNWFKITLTYFVPYAVSTYDAASVRIRQVASAERI